MIIILKILQIQSFGTIPGYEKAFLIQNMCPVSSEYIKNEYFDSQTNIPVRIDGVFEKDLIKRCNECFDYKEITN